MKRYTLTLGQIADGHKHPHPERTARRAHANGWDTIFQVWPSRAAMLKTIDIQDKAPPSRRRWAPLVPRGEAPEERATMAAATTEMALARRFRALGFEIWQMGGGCLAWGRTHPDGAYTLVTEAGGGDLPGPSDPVAVGVYGPSPDDEEPRTFHEYASPEAYFAAVEAPED